MVVAIMIQNQGSHLPGLLLMNLAQVAIVGINNT